MSGMDVLRKRIARALWENRYPGVEQAGPLADLALTDADAVIAALGLVEWTSVGLGGQEFQHYAITWERIEEDA